MEESMYKFSMAGASLKLKVRKRSKMGTNHPVVLYSIFYIVSCQCSESKQCVFSSLFFFKKEYLLASFRFSLFNSNFGQHACVRKDV